ncbi:WD40 repeat protein, partial [Coemansia sp. RSA 2603]
VLVHDGAFAEGTGGGSADAAAAQQWQAASVPAEYVAGAWPLRHVAVSGDGRHVAVGGRRGVAVGGVRSGKWRLLRTREQERQIRVGGGLLWLGSHVVAACGAHVVVFTDALRGALDGDAAVRVHVGARVLAMSAHDALVLVACGDGRVRQVAVFAQGSGVRVDVRGVVDVGDGGARLQLRRLRSVQWVPSAQFARAPALLVHEGTRLRVVSRSGAWTVSERAELTVTSGVHFGNMHSTVWWFDGRLLHAALVSLEDFMDGGALRSDGGGARRLAVRPSFYPVAIAAALGMAVGVDQDWTLDDAACSPALAQLPVRAKLYLPSVLARMLADSSSGSHDALLYAACFEHLAFFAHAMEILLHEAVEDAQPAVLRRAVAMLGNFGAFPEIIVHCARKTEAASWPALFACLGGPESFFRRCVHAGRLGTATQCLIILHTLAPHAAERGVLMLLARAVDRRAQTLCVEILRFVRMAAAEDATMAGLLDKVQCVEG